MSDKAFDEPGAIDLATPYQPLEPAAPAIVLPGVQLAARREQLKLTIEHVANQLNLAPRQIQALEADNYGALPGMASVRGFIRAYAKLLKMDAAPLVQAVANETTATSVEPLGPALSTTPFSDGRTAFAGRRFPLSWLIALTLLAILLTAVAAHQLGWLPALSQSISQKIDGGLALLPASRPSDANNAAPAEFRAADASDKTAEPAKVVVSELPAAVAPAPKPSEKVEPAKNEQAKSEQAPAKATVTPLQAAPVVPVAPVAPAAPAVAQAADAVAPAAKDMLVLKLHQDSWIDIRRSNNSRVVSRLARAGETEAVKISGPLAVTIGNAAGVAVSLRGKPVAIEPEANSNVAHLTLR